MGNQGAASEAPLPVIASPLFAQDSPLELWGMVGSALLEQGAEFIGCVYSERKQTSTNSVNFMKVPSSIKYLAASVLIPVAGFAIVQTQSQSSSAVAATPATSSNLIAQSTPAPNPQKGRGNWGAKLMQQLNLSADQQSQIEAIQAQSKTASAGLREQMKTARDEYKTLLASDNATPEQLRQTHQRLQALGQQLGNIQFEKMLQIRNVLTSEQRAKLAELKQQYRKGPKSGQRQSAAYSGLNAAV